MSGKTVSDLTINDLRVGVTEIPVTFLLDNHVLVLPENYPKGPKWIDTDEDVGSEMTVVVEKRATGRDLMLVPTPAEFAVLARAWAVENGYLKVSEVIDPATFRQWAVDNGWVEPKACGECKGGTYCATHNQAGVDDWMYEGDDVCVSVCRLSTERSPCRPCPSCGGTGREEL